MLFGSIREQVAQTRQLPRVVHGRALVNNELTCEAIMKFMLMDA